MYKPTPKYNPPSSESEADTEFQGKSVNKEGKRRENKMLVTTTVNIKQYLHNTPKFRNI
jgi:hypothetical protein